MTQALRRRDHVYPTVFGRAAKYESTKRALTWRPAGAAFVLPSMTFYSDRTSWPSLSRESDHAEAATGVVSLAGSQRSL